MSSFRIWTFLCLCSSWAIGAEPTRLIPAKGLEGYLEYEGVEPHARAWETTAAHSVLDKTSAGSMTLDTLGQVASYHLGRIPGMKASQEDFETVARHALRHGVILGVYGHKEAPPSIVSVLPGGANGEVRTAFDRILRVLIERKETRVTTTRGRRVVRVFLPAQAGGAAPSPHPLLQWWFEGNDLVLMLSPGAEDGLEKDVHDAVEGKLETVATHPGRKLAIAEGQAIPELERLACFFIETTSDTLFARLTERAKDQPLMPKLPFASPDNAQPVLSAIPGPPPTIDLPSPPPAPVPPPDFPKMVGPPRFSDLPEAIPDEPFENKFALPKARISEIRFEGVSEDRAEALVPLLKSKVGDLLDLATIAKDVVTLMATREWEDVTPYYDRDEKAVGRESYRLIFKLKGRQEKTPFPLTRIAGCYGIQDRALFRVVRVQTESPGHELAKSMGLGTLRREKLPPVRRDAVSFGVAAVQLPVFQQWLMAVGEKYDPTVLEIYKGLKSRLLEASGVESAQEVFDLLAPQWLLVLLPNADRGEGPVPVLVAEPRDRDGFVKTLERISTRFNAFIREQDGRADNRNLVKGDDLPTLSLVKLPAPDVGYRITSPSGLAPWVAEANTGPVILVGAERVALATRLEAARAAVEASNRPGGGKSPTSETQAVLAKFPGDLFMVSYRTAEDSPWPSFFGGLPPLAQLLNDGCVSAGSEEANSDDMLEFFGLRKPGSLKIRISPDRIPDEKSIRNLLLPRVTAAAVDAQGIRWMVREPLLSLHPPLVKVGFKKVLEWKGGKPKQDTRFSATASFSN